MLISTVIKYCFWFLEKVWSWCRNLLGSNLLRDLSGQSASVRDHEYKGVKRLLDCLHDFCSCEPGKESVVLLFFHGMALDQLNDRENTDDTPFKTWTFQNDDSKVCWPSVMFREDEYLRNKNIVVRALTVVYDSSKFETSNSGRLDIFLLAENFCRLIPSKIVEKDKNKPIIFVAHSFGGFVVQELIDNVFSRARRGNSCNLEQELLTNLGGVFFYGTPFRALEQETFDHFFPRPIPRRNGTSYSRFFELLETFNASLARKQEGFERNLSAIASSYRGGKSIKVHAVFEVNTTTVREWTGLIALEGTARYIGPGNSNSIQSDHFDICRPPASPDGFGHPIYQYLQNFIDLVTSDCPL